MPLFTATVQVESHVCTSSLLVAPLHVVRNNATKTKTTIVYLFPSQISSSWSTQVTDQSLVVASPSYSYSCSNFYSFTTTLADSTRSIRLLLAPTLRLLSCTPPTTRLTTFTILQHQHFLHEFTLTISHKIPTHRLLHTFVSIVCTYTHLKSHATNTAHPRKP